jgi:SRSO17 transposase
MPIFSHSSSQESFERYCTGLLTDLPQKTCDGIASTVADTTTQRLQYLLTDADWEAVALDRQRTEQMAQDSPAGGMLAIDDTTFPKQGKHSVGVTHQYCGELGKRANCQAFVTAEYVAKGPTPSTPMHWPLSGRLFLPDDWASDVERRRRAHVPDEIEKQSKIEIALDLVDQAIDWNVPFELVTADAAYGHFRDFFEGLEERELSYACAVKCNFGVRKPSEVQAKREAPPPKHNGKFGRKPKRHPAPLYRVDGVIADLPKKAWETITWREGSKGPMRRQFTALRMHWGKGNQTRSVNDHRTTTSEEGWLIAERLPGEDGGESETKYYFSNLPAETPLKELAMAVRSRWPIEQFYQDSKQHCGLGDFQGRRWDGLHRHVALAMLSYSFLALTRWQAGSPSVLPMLPEVHRQVLLALLTDVVERWAQMKRPELGKPLARLLSRAPPPKESRSVTK